jgi:hypothetical protein
LADVLPGMTGLRWIYWNAQVLPDNVIQSMKQCPNMRMELLVSQQGGTGPAEGLLESMI